MKLTRTHTHTSEESGICNAAATAVGFVFVKIVKSGFVYVVSSSASFVCGQHSVAVWQSTCRQGALHASAARNSVV